MKTLIKILKTNLLGSKSALVYKWMVIAIVLLYSCTEKEIKPTPIVFSEVNTSSISEFSAKTTTSITNSGNKEISDYGFAISKTSNEPVIDGSSIKKGNLDPATPTPIKIEELFNNLASNSNYYVRPYAVTSFGTTYGQTASFKTLSIIQAGIKTLGAENISHNFAKLNGRIESKGTYPVTEYGIVWATSANPSTDVPTKLAIKNNVTSYPVNFSAEAQNLTPKTTYYFRAYAIANDVTVYGENLSFSTSDLIQPGIVTGNAKEISINSAILEGVVQSGGTYPISEYGFVYATAANPTTAHSKVSLAGNITSFPKSFELRISNLQLNTSYYYRAYLISNGVISYGENKSFKTLDMFAPEIRTDDNPAVGTLNATLSGTLLKAGSHAITEYGLVWSTTTNPTTANSKKTFTGNVTTFPKSFTATINDLNPATTYYYRAYVIMNGVTTYGENKSFKTQNVSQPGIRTDNPSDITDNHAIFNGTLTAKGTYPISEYGFVYASSVNPTTANNKKAFSGNETNFPKSFNSVVNDLNPATTYYYRAYVISNGITTYGENKNFTTSLVRPNVVTGGAQSIAGRGLLLSGSVQNPGSYGISEMGIVYATSNNPTTANSKLSKSGSGISYPHYFDMVLSALPGNTLYYRAYAISNGETYYGETKVYNNTYPPSLATGNYSFNPTNNQVNLSGIINTDGNPGIKEYGVVWATNTREPTISNNKMSNSGSPANTPYTFTKLTNGDTFGECNKVYFRTYAITNDNVAYYSSEIKSFDSPRCGKP